MNKIGRWCLKNRLNKNTKDTSLNRSVFESPLQQKIKNEEKKEKHQEPKVTAKVYSITKEKHVSCFGGILLCSSLDGAPPRPSQIEIPSMMFGKPWCFHTRKENMYFLSIMGFPPPKTHFQSQSILPSFPWKHP